MRISILLPTLLLLALGLPGRSPGGAALAADPPATNPARARLLAHLDDEERCALAFLEQLGWQIVAGPRGSEVEVIGGRPASRASLEEARLAGDLRIVLAPDTPVDVLRALAVRLGTLANTLPSRLAFQHRVAAAVRAATSKLDANIQRDNLKFPKLLILNSPWFKMTPPRPQWSEGKLECKAVSPPSVAVSAFYTEPAVVECYVGQWVALYAKWMEVFGPAAFDEEIRSEELMLGRPGEMRTTPFGRFLADENSSNWRSFVIGPEDYDVEPGLALARMGPVAFPGVTGVIENVEEEIFTNDNFMIVSVSPAACRTLAENGGFEYVRRVNEEIWKIHQWGKRGAIRGSSGIEARDRIAAILEDPVFSEILVFVHPYGIVPLARMVKNRIVETHRPVKLRIYRNGVDDAFYQRYRAWFQRRCMATEDR